MISIKKYLSFFILLLLLTTRLYSDELEENKTNYFLKFGIGASYNIHTTGFKELPSVKIVGNDFSEGSGIGSYFNIGYEYRFEENYLGILSRYGLDLNYRTASGLIAKETSVGNIISENSFYEGFSRHEIDASIAFLTISPKVVLTPVDDLGLDILLGISIGTPIIGSFDQSEIPLSDFDIKYLANNPRVNGEQIPDMNTFYASLDLGVRYKFYKTDNFDFMADLGGTLALQNIVKDVNWRANSVSLGVSIIYNFDEKKIDPPPPPPVPKPIPVEKPIIEELAQKMRISYKGKQIADGEAIEYSYLKNIYKEKYSILPLLYYKANSARQQGIETKGLEGRSQTELLSSVAAYLKENKDVSIELIGVSSAGKESGIIEIRAGILTDSLLSYGLSKDRIKISANYSDSVKYKYTELAEEEEKIEIKFSNGNKLVEFLLSESISYYSEDNDMVSIEIESNYEDFESEIDIQIDGKYPKENLLEGMGNHKYEIDLVEYLKNYTLKQLSILSIAGSGEKENKLEQKIRIKKSISENVVVNEVKGEGQSEKTYILGYFGFDSSKFKAIDEEIRKIVDEAIKSNKKVIFLPLTDNLGDEKHNDNLAKKRAKSALSLFKENTDIEIKTSTIPYFSNNHPYGRTLNRSIVVKIITNE
jgi:outer membrane protein OmpA-like peptidoglycan-associated protein